MSRLLLPLPENDNTEFLCHLRYHTARGRRRYAAGLAVHYVAGNQIVYGFRQDGLHRCILEWRR